jgi:hypothetical protein
LILYFEFDQHLGSHKHVINIIMWFRDMGCYKIAIKKPKTVADLLAVADVCIKASEARA